MFLFCTVDGLAAGAHDVELDRDKCAGGARGSGWASGHSARGGAGGRRGNMYGPKRPGWRPEWSRLWSRSVLSGESLQVRGSGALGAPLRHKTRHKISGMHTYSAGGLGMRGGGDAGAGVGGETGARPSGMLWLLVADSTSP